MTFAERQEHIRQMLIRLVDARAQGSLGPSLEGHGDRLLLFPPTWNPAYRELDRCLQQMRAEPVLRWHTLAWYAEIEYRQKPRYVYIRKRNDPTPRKQLAGYQLEPCRHDDANRETAEQGITWLNHHYQWNHIHLKHLHQATGTTLHP